MTVVVEAGALAPEGLQATIGVVPMGDVGDVAVRIVAAYLQAVLGLAVDILERRPVNENCYVPDRRQYDAAKLITALKECSASWPYLKIVAVLSVDLGVPILRFVFGEAEMSGRCAVVSGYRLRRNEDGTDAGLEVYYERLAKVALHETAHTLSLFHCDDPRCLMHFAPSTKHLDLIRLFFCSRCEFLLKKTVETLFPFRRP